MSEDDFLLRDTSVIADNYKPQKRPHAKLHFRFLYGSEKSSFDFRKAPEGFHKLHSHIVKSASAYVQGSEDLASTFAAKFLNLQAKYSSGLFPLDKSKWPQYISDIAQRLSKNFGLYRNDDQGSYSIEKVLDSCGIAFFVIPEDKEYEALDGFATCFMGVPILAIVEKANYRRMFFTLAHELYHLLFQEGEDLADVFAGSFLVPDKNKVGEIIKRRGEFKSALPELLEEFSFASIECLANTSARYGLIDKKIKAIWLSGGKKGEKLGQKKKEIYRKVTKNEYNWNPKISF